MTRAEYEKAKRKVDKWYADNDCDLEAGPRFLPENIKALKAAIAKYEDGTPETPLERWDRENGTQFYREQGRR